MAQALLYYMQREKELKMKQITRLFVAAAGLAMFLVSTGCAGVMANDPRRVTESEYKAYNSAVTDIDIDNAWKTDDGPKDMEPSIGSDDWYIKYRPLWKALSTGLFACLALAGQENDKELAVPFSALLGYGAASLGVYWNKDSDVYKWSVLGGAAVGFVTGINIIIDQKLYTGQYGWEWLITTSVTFLSTIAGAGIGGIVGDILHGFELANNKRQG